MTKRITGWVRPMADMSAFAGQFEDVTLRLRAIAGAAGSRLRVELSNLFGDEPLVVARLVVVVAGEAVTATFSGQTATTVPVASSGWTDVLALSVQPDDEIIVDLYAPTRVTLSTGNFARTPVEISVAGDHAGEIPFPGVATPTIPAPDGSEMSIPVPFLRAIEVDGNAGSVIACLGDSITAGGWPEIAAALLVDHGAPVMLNLGIAGNRLRTDPAHETASFGRSGLSRFADDVLTLAGVTDVVVALGTNDLGIPGAMAPLEELPTVDELVSAYQELTRKSAKTGIGVIIATITPFMGAEGLDLDRDGLRNKVNKWIRSNASRVADFDLAVRSSADWSRLAVAYDSGDHLHPNEAGEQRLAQTIAAVLADRS